MKRIAFSLIVLLTSSALVAGEYLRPPGKTLRELAQARGFHVSATFPTLYETRDL